MQRVVILNESRDRLFQDPSRNVESQHGTQWVLGVCKAAASNSKSCDGVALRFALIRGWVGGVGKWGEWVGQWVWLGGQVETEYETNHKTLRDSICTPENSFQIVQL